MFIKPAELANNIELNLNNFNNINDYNHLIDIDKNNVNQQPNYFNVDPSNLLQIPLADNILSVMSLNICSLKSIFFYTLSGRTGSALVWHSEGRRF